VPPEPKRPLDPVEEAVEQWRAHGWDGGERLKAALSVIRVEELIRDASAAVLRPLGLSYARHELLALLYFTRHGELPMGKISQRLFVHPKSVTTTVDSLERLGLVERAPHPTDRRATLARITGAGRELVERSTPELLRSQFALEGLSESEARTLVALLRKVRRNRGDF
jgi:DNA-binding MarR family transcriptional regulator